MIVFDLKCANDHVFEAWFASSAAFQEQADKGLVPCPVCGSTKVSKSLMAPNLANAKKRSETPPAPNSAMTQKAAMETRKVAEMHKAMREMQKTIEDNFDYVGNGFAEEARKIHYGESEERNIYGETSEEEAKSLDEEGVKVSRVPWLPKENA